MAYNNLDELMGEWEKFQIENASKVIINDDFNITNVKYVAGLDISFDKKNPNKVCAYITIVDINNNIVYEDYKLTKLNIPYISGFLAFREIPVYLDLLNKLKNTNPEYYPDVILMDGFGLLHQRGFGCACHLGVLLDIPCVGVGKTLMCIDNLNEKKIKNDFKKLCNKGDFIELIGKTGKVRGVALKGTIDTMNPIYVTIGHKINLKASIEIVCKLCKYRIPEPIRNSDIKSKLYF